MIGPSKQLRKYNGTYKRVFEDITSKPENIKILKKIQSEILEFISKQKVSNFSSTDEIL